MGSNTTIKDVAKKAGVSITTVSFVLNNRADVVISQKVKKRVLQVAKALDYHPSAMAAGLAGKRTRNIGVLLNQETRIISNQFYSFVIEGIVQETIEKNFNLYFSIQGLDYKGPQSLPKIVREKNVDGILLIARSDLPMVNAIRERKIPMVAIDNYPAIPGVDTVGMNNHQGGLLAAEHLLKLGHRHIGILTFAKGRPSIDGRVEGWRQAHARNGLSWSEDYLFESDSLSFNVGYEKTKEVLKRHKKLSALFCVNDEMAAGALRAAREMGRRVPGDLSVVGFDNITMSNYTDPPLTTVSAPKERMGILAVSRLLEILEKKDTAVRHQDVPVELVVRGSTARV